MKKRISVLAVAALVISLLAMSGVAQSAMWVGGEIGGNFNSAKLDVSAGNLSGSTSIFIRPSVIGGATIGYDFVNAGFGAYAWPDWMKYFSFAMDITYNKLELHSDYGVLTPSSRLNGYEVAWTFLFMAHYGFLPDSEVPSGRINPYIGVGPAIVWSGFDLGGAGVNAMNVALVVEPGIRWVCFKNVSVDTSFRWRYCAPSYSTGGINLNVNPLNQFSFLVRANYHF